jgi:2-keto-3-deoxy-L-rhamnonate aldolase RhmA
MSNGEGVAVKWENPVRTSLKEGKPVVGITITAASVEVAAQAASLGFDFLWIEMEHSPITLETVRQIVLANRGLKSIPFVRVPVNEFWTAKRVLDAGALGVIFPFVSTAEAAQRAAQACKYPPLGRRGAGPGLATFRWPSAESYYDFADRNVMVLVNIEEAEALENLDQIAATPGVDVLFVGTNDLSFSMGLRGQQSDPRVSKGLDKVIEACRRHGKFAGAPVSTANQAREYIDRGVLFLQTPTELRYMEEGAKQFLEPLGKSAAQVKTQALY